MQGRLSEKYSKGNDALTCLPFCPFHLASYSCGDGLSTKPSYSQKASSSQLYQYSASCPFLTPNRMISVE